ncbi:DUF4469 domain-containing protein [Hymenobacter sp. BT175]|uniref:DNA-binding domain-containing protein n=1 Tax=Hymenobacter translucens TaxID=2886507 RepID=UPI001D0E6155|nr:DNA-binding domain-containing protein [Hymenobacter translucens]MCC2545929.1 DUF4469 domain-containing protein [Hymenobacter translucens]
MPIRYSLIENKLTAAPDDYRGQVQHNTSVSIEDIMRKISRPGSTVTAAEGLAFWEELSQAVVAEVQAGNRVVSDLFVVGLGLTGTFDSAQDAFDAARHQLRVRVSPGLRLRKAEQGLSVEQVRADTVQPQPDQLHDFSSDTTNDRLTKGGTARLTGERLKFDDTDVTQGLFLVATDGTETYLTRLLTNKPSELLFMVPATLANGQYRLVVRAKPFGNQSLRTGELGSLLTIS